MPAGAGGGSGVVRPHVEDLFRTFGNGTTKVHAFENVGATGDGCPGQSAGDDLAEADQIGRDAEGLLGTAR